jgi:hypothetical protein
MQGMARPPGTRKREERLFVGLIVADVHSPWAVWVDCDADLGRTRLAAIEARLLLVVERLVELLHDRPHGAHRRPVQANAPQAACFDKFNECTREISRRPRLIIWLQANMRFVYLPNAEAQQFFGLLESMSAQFLDSERWHRNGPGAPDFGGLSRTPLFVCSKLAATEIWPASSSILRQRSAANSPRRRPHKAPSRIGINSAFGRAASMIAAVPSASSTFICFRSTWGARAVPSSRLAALFPVLELRRRLIPQG